MLFVINTKFITTTEIAQKYNTDNVDSRPNRKEFGDKRQK